jgi:hypothetical protein
MDHLKPLDHDDRCINSPIHRASQPDRFIVVYGIVKVRKELACILRGRSSSVDLGDGVTAQRCIAKQRQYQVDQFVRGKVDQSTRLEEVGDVGQACILSCRQVYLPLAT